MYVGLFACIKRTACILPITHLYRKWSAISDPPCHTKSTHGSLGGRLERVLARLRNIRVLAESLSNDVIWGSSTVCLPWHTSVCLAQQCMRCMRRGSSLKVSCKTGDFLMQMSAKTPPTLFPLHTLLPPPNTHIIAGRFFNLFAIHSYKPCCIASSCTASRLTS